MNLRSLEVERKTVKLVIVPWLGGLVRHVKRNRKWFRRYRKDLKREGNHSPLRMKKLKKMIEVGGKTVVVLVSVVISFCYGLSLLVSIVK